MYRSQQVYLLSLVCAPRSFPVWYRNLRKHCFCCVGWLAWSAKRAKEKRSTLRGMGREGNRPFSIPRFLLFIIQNAELLAAEKLFFFSFPKSERAGGIKGASRQGSSFTLSLIDIIGSPEFVSVVGSLSPAILFLRYSNLCTVFVYPSFFIFQSRAISLKVEPS
jgi:hypothetical protein